MTAAPFTITTPDGRVLDGLVAGEAAAPLVLLMHGTPQGHDIRPQTEAAARDLGLRVASFARPGYAGSARLPGRDVAAVVPDALAVADALHATHFAVVGGSGGGPHALAFGALVPDRCPAVATIAGVGPWAADGLDFLAGMGDGNQVEFAAALRGEPALRELLSPWRAEMVDAGPQGTFDAMVTVLSPPDQEIFSGAVAAELHASVSLALRDGIDGWVDDDLAFTRPWGFAPADVKVPVFLWQGGQDLMVPAEHGRWLARELPDCRARFEPDDGHLTIGFRRMREVLADLAAALR